MKKIIIWTTTLGLLTWGCQPKPNAGDLVKNMVVSTQYDPTVNFGLYHTYYLPNDTLSYFNSSDTNQADTLQCAQCSGSSSSLGPYASIITAELQTKLNAAGYTQSLSKKYNPDLKVYVFVVENYNVYQTYSYYPYGYGYGYGFGYGYGYGGYGYGSYYPSYSVSDQANLYIEIFDLKNLYQGKPRLAWYCSIGDLVSSPDLGNLTVAAIDRAFAQSSYIKKQ
ncbi:MAG: DUF4136 domain-containing protein [Bacteroidetes bacterium]|nr:DUF4136 domain-containing protein [Bacteroidota bacterium]MBS1980771.1 DUF4136 domain-containing protein [Bacteroidota bacterium]